ncbi:MAG: GntR family transcriptional regulator [Actinobacteria bacterium]|nr:GntR family transcriptional regulator [Actinomycetota bacterium]MBU1945042.1 GntR family transcriptional regulator [Actinomycetota bacterium]MBU2686622.1 GntR family transcriptional regulator [Actinomycetota bacterium]
MLTPVRSEKKSEQVYEKLRDSILTGEFQAGDRLPTERRLCEILEVNRSSVREALKRLEQARLIEVRQGSGCLVLDFKASAGFDLLNDLLLPGGRLDDIAVRSIFEFRMLMCSEIARLAARRIQEPELEELRRILEEIEALDPGDIDRLQLLDSRFLYTMARASENLAFILILNSTSDIYLENRNYFSAMFAEQMGMRDVYRELLVALEEHDEKRSMELFGELLRRGEKAFFEHLESIA